MVSEIIIVGGGASISEGISLGLKEKLKDRCVFLTNYSYKHFNGTCLFFLDRDFYVPEHAKQKQENKVDYPDIYEELKQLPLIIGLNKKNGIEEFVLPNTILTPWIKKEIKITALTGVFSLTIAEKLNPKQIFLLGFDWNKRDPNTIPTGKDYNPQSNLDIHYYKREEINHRGQGWMGYYENHNPNKIFEHFNNSNIKIYNVSPNSNIDVFEKIDYPTFFSKLDNVVYNQEDLRKEIREIIQIKK